MDLRYTITTKCQNPLAPQSGGVSRSTFSELSKRFPEFVNGQLFKAELAGSDPIVAELAGVVSDLGIALPNHANQKNPEIHIVIAREYTASELEGFDYFFLSSVEAIGCIDNASIASIALDPESDLVTQRDDIGGLTSEWHLVAASESIRHEIEEQAFRSLALEPIDGSGLLLLRGVFTLPPAINRFTGNEGDLFSYTEEVDKGHGCWPSEGYFGMAQLAYSQSALTARGAFDIANTHEEIGYGHQPKKWPGTVLSSRMRKWLLGRGWDHLTFNPVNTAGPPIEGLTSRWTPTPDPLAS